MHTHVRAGHTRDAGLECTRHPARVVAQRSPGPHLQARPDLHHVQERDGPKICAANAWGVLQWILENDKCAAAADGAAALHGHAPREEAASALILNHVAVLGDMTNLSAAESTSGKSAAMAHFQPLSAGDAVFVDQLLRECARRLLV